MSYYDNSLRCWVVDVVETGKTLDLSEMVSWIEWLEWAEGLTTVVATPAIWSCVKPDLRGY